METQIKILTPNELNAITKFWTMVYSSLELLDMIVVRESKETKEDEPSIAEIRGDINRTMLTARRKYSVAIRAEMGNKKLQ